MSSTPDREPAGSTLQDARLPVEIDPPLIKLTGVTKAFGATQALRDASFELRAGEVHALAGENGSGKSTLMKILSGVHQPDSGSLELHGSAVPFSGAPKAAQQRGIITVFQEI